jgi:IclR family acetate operon transcriptional repressor
LIKYTLNTITSREKLLQELERIRQEGIALDNEEFDLGLRCVAAPIFGTEGEIIASISVSGPANRITDETVPIYTKYVKASAEKISNLLNRRKD